MSSLIRASAGPGARVEVSPALAGWRLLSFRVLALAPGETLEAQTGGEEAALVPLSGTARLEHGTLAHLVSRRGVFEELPHVLYLPPRTPYRVSAIDGPLELAVGSAPAEGRLPARLIRPDELRVEIRGGANATRQITHLLGPELPAERLVLFEVYTPSGNWSSWPPHRHDGRMGSPYVEETYYYRLDPADGFAVQRLYTGDTGRDELVLARDGDLVLVREGYHPVAAAPGTNAYYLNVLAGESRDMTPHDDPAYAWVREDWNGRALELPVGGAGRA